LREQSAEGAIVDEIAKVLDLGFLTIGPCLVVYSLVAIVKTRSFIRRSVEVAGEVVRLERSKDRDRYGYTYAPVFSFIAADGNTYTVTSDVSSSPAGFDVGDPVEVRYDPADPQAARIHSFFQTWGGAVISGAVGVVFFSFGCMRLGLLHLAR
jgi:hypothetical protein